MFASYFAGFREGLFSRSGAFFSGRRGLSGLTPEFPEEFRSKN